MMSCMSTKIGPLFTVSFERAEGWLSSSHGRVELPTHLQGWVTPVLANKASLALTPEFVGCLLNVPATCECISGTDLLRQVYVLPHWDTNCRPNFSSHPVTVYWPDMGPGKSEKGGKWCGGLGAAVGPQWGPGAKPLVGVWGQRPQKLKFFSVCHHKKQHSGAWKSDICKSASFMFRPDIYLIILKIALKMSFWCSKNKILAKVSNYLTVGILL